MNLDTIRNICLAFPGATEEVQWETHLLFKVGGRMFCIADLEGEQQPGFKVPDDEFADWCNRIGVIPAPHLARAKWVKVTEAGKIRQAEWREALKTSYELVKAKLPKKVQAEL